MRIERVAVVIAAACLAGGRVSDAQGGVPNLVCRGEDIVSVRNIDLKTDRSRSSDLYRFVGGKLYISSQGRDEYFYNDVRESEPGRYTSAHKTIIFDGPGFKSATAVHVDGIETRVLKLRCTAS
jgi:hypothetical protein